MSKNEATRIFYEIAKGHHICKEDFPEVDMNVDGLRAYVEAKCRSSLSDAKKKSMVEEFYRRTTMELYIY